jgi:predicted nucleotide-binding protein
MSAILLMLPRAVAKTRIEEQIDRGRTELLNAPIQNHDDYRQACQALTRWQKYNVDLLRTLFSDEEPSTEFDATVRYVHSTAPVPLQADIQELHEDIETYLNRLQSVLERIDLWSEAPTVANSLPTARGLTGGSVFIVHGHAGREHEVARCIDHLGLSAVILQERLHGGSSTLIEKLEREAGPCGYAIVIYTGDDEGRDVGSSDFSLRARENVVLELGYFIGKLGRDRVTILHDALVEVPSDFHGVGYYPLDPGGGWRTKIGGEPKRAGLLSS